MAKYLPTIMENQGILGSLLDSSQLIFSQTLLLKVYASYEGLTRHVDLIHRKIKRFECEFCGYKTNCNNRLRNHTKTLHTKEPFHCNYCDFISYSHKAHQKHTSKVHAPMKKKKIIVDH